MTVLTLNHIKQESTREKVHQAIKEAIITGNLRTGSRITETQLATGLNVSRAIVREALQQLAHEGLVEQNSYKGTRVVQLTPEQVEEVLAVRVLLESEAVRLAKARMTEADKRRLHKSAVKLEAAQGNVRAYVEQDLMLHRQIWELSGNQTLQRLLVQATGPLFAMGSIIRNAKLENQNQPDTKEQINDHVRLVAKICDGTPDEAVHAMHEHLTLNSKYTRENFERFYRSQKIEIAPI